MSLHATPRGAVAAATAAHGGCALGMSAGLLLCTLALPLPLLLVAEVLLTALGAWLLVALLRAAPPRRGSRKAPAYVVWQVRQ